MKYMLDKIELLEKKDEIISLADKIFDLLIQDKNLDNSEKLMTIELAMAKVNYELYHISGDDEKWFI